MDESGGAPADAPASEVPAEAGAVPEPCRNCGVTLADQFCPACGQKRVPGPMRTDEIVHDLLQSVADVDRGFLHTFVGLIRNPGRTCREYVEGKRAVHAPPFRYFVVILAIWFAFPALIGFDFAAYAAEELEKARAAWPPGLEEGGRVMRAVLDRFELMNQKLYEWRRWTVLGNLPVYAAGGWALFRTTKRTFAEWFAFSLYVTAQSLALGIVSVALLAAGLGLVNAAVSLAIFPYVIWGYHGFSGEGLGASIGKGLVVLIGGGMVMAVVTYGLAFLLTL